MTTLLRNAAPLSGTVVLKVGGRTVETPEGRAELARRVGMLVAQRVHVVLVHGGGAQVTAALARAGLEARFVDGLRVTDAATLDVAEPVFAHIGKTIAHALSRAGAPALALTGRDAQLIEGVVKDARLGRVGTPTRVNADMLRHLYHNGVTPVVGPVAVDAEGPLNVNADEVASALARALHARDLVLLTDVPGVKDADGRLLGTLSPESAKRLVADGIATGGMVPKIQNALDALAAGVARVRIVDDAGLGTLAEGGTAGTSFEV